MSAEQKKDTSYYEYFKRRIRHGGVARLLLEVLDKVGINLLSFILFSEGETEGVDSSADPGFENAEIRQLGKDDIPALEPYARHPGRDVPLNKLYQRLDDGNHCVALFLDGKLAGFSWYDLDRCNFFAYTFKLRENEAYLYDAYTAIDFRGKGLGPRIRRYMHRELARQGRDVFYSVSDRLNLPAIRLKEKLDSRWLLTSYYLVLFSRWKFTFMTKRFDADAPHRDR